MYVAGQPHNHTVNSPFLFCCSNSPSGVRSLSSSQRASVSPNNAICDAGLPAVETIQSKRTDYMRRYRQQNQQSAAVFEIQVERMQSANEVLALELELAREEVSTLRTMCLNRQ